MADIKDLIKVTPNGIQKLDYADIVKVILDEYRKIYGADIDLDPRTADARFVYAVCEIINSGCEVISQLYNNLNPSTATGVFLDILCSLTNVTRRSATASTAKVKMVNNGNADVTIQGDSTIWNLIDDAGNEWTILNKTSSDITIKAGATMFINYQSSVLGRTATSSFTFEVVDAKTSNIALSVESFSVGQEEESDADLRYRRANDSGYGISVLEGMQGALRRILGVTDTYVYSYSGDTSESASLYVNNTSKTIPAHSIAVLLRYDNVNEPNKQQVAEAIRSYITPGIQTNGDTTYNFFTGVNETGEVIRWFVTKPVNPTIKITITPLSNFAGISTARSVAQALTNYLNNLPISSKYQLSSLVNVIQNADPLYMSRSTFVFSSISGLGVDGTNPYPNRGCYFDYGSRIDTDYTVSYDSNVITITKA